MRQQSADSRTLGPLLGEAAMAAQRPASATLQLLRQRTRRRAWMAWQRAPALRSSVARIVAWRPRRFEELFIDKDLGAIDRYWAEPYSQHNPIAKSGVMTFRSLMSGLVSSAQFKYELYLALADCDLAVVYGRYSQTGTIFDMFRIKNGKLMEHWDSESSVGAAAASLDGLFVERANVQEARALFSAFAEPLLAGDAARAEGFLSASFVEHGGATGPSAFTALLRTDTISYTKVHHVIVDGNFVFALSEGKRGAEPHGFYDLFRVEAGKLAEHWSARRKVPASTASGLGIF
jgi:predicted SnoaL-like aldol condensation-catalyzing enzyme